MFANILDRFSPALAFCAKLFSAAGLDLTAIVAAGDENALKVLMDSARKNASDVASAVEAATKALQEQLAAETARAALATARANLLTSALTACGITPKAADEKAGLTAADVEQAIRARASILASEQLAKHGLDNPLPVAPSADASKPAAAAKPELKGLERVTAAFRAQREAALA